MGSNESDFSSAISGLKSIREELQAAIDIQAGLNMSDAPFDKLRYALEKFSESPTLEGRRFVLEVAQDVFGPHSQWYADLRSSTIKLLDQASLP